MELDEHVMRYRAGSHGFASAGVADREPGWTCSCAAWSFEAHAMPSRKAGNNLIEAERAHAAHRQARREFTR